MGKKILHIIDSFAVGGAELLLKNTVPLLTDYEHVICYLGGDETLKDYFKEYPVYNLEHKGNLYILRTAGKLRSIVRREKADIIHAHLIKSTLIAKIACPKNCKLVYTIHNLLSKDAFEVNRLSLIAEKLTNKKRFSVIGVSAATLKDYDESAGIKGKSYVVYNYVEEKFFSVPYVPGRSIKEEFRLIAVGNLRRQKNYENLLKAFTYLKDFPVSLSVYGTGSLEKKLDQFIRENEIHVSLKGRVANVAAVLPDYDAYIMSSLFEGYGIAPMEAMAAGMPLLLSDIPVFREVAADKPLYFDPEDPKAIANAILAAYNNWEQLVKQSAANREYAFTIGSKNVYKERLENVYQTILNDK